MQPQAKPHEGIHDVLRKANGSALLTDGVKLPEPKIEEFEHVRSDVPQASAMQACT